MDSSWDIGDDGGDDGDGDGDVCWGVVCLSRESPLGFGGSCGGGGDNWIVVVCFPGMFVGLDISCDDDGCLCSFCDV